MHGLPMPARSVEIRGGEDATRATAKTRKSCAR
jgi:hypothetical protein